MTRCVLFAGPEFAQRARSIDGALSRLAQASILPGQARTAGTFGAEGIETGLNLVVVM